MESPPVSDDRHGFFHDFAIHDFALSCLFAFVPLAGWGEGLNTEA
jgi:hypothetical protein